MKPINIIRFGAGCAFMASWLLTSCMGQPVTQTNNSATNYPASISQWREIEPTRMAKLVIAVVADDLSQTYTNLVAINDLSFVHSLYWDLVAQKSVIPKPRFLIYPKLIVFSDREDNVLCAFKYWLTSTPANTLIPCEVQRDGNIYRVKWFGLRVPSVGLPDFDKRVQTYFNALE